MKEADFLRFIQKISHKTGYSLVGDDAAILSRPQSSKLVATTDQFIEGTHFTWNQMNAQQVGYKAVVQALSDLAAMAAEPMALLCSAAWPASQNTKIMGAFRGIEKACLEYNVPLVGGDISRSQKFSHFDFCAIGTASSPALKSKASPGDLIVLTGPTGLAAAGLLSVQKNWNYPLLIQKFKKPKAQIKISQLLQKKKYLTAATDISDSLSISLREIAQHSQCSFILEKDKLPTHPQLKKFCKNKNQNLQNYILSGGEDYQLLMAVKPRTPQKFLLDHGLVPIGYVIKSSSRQHKIFLKDQNQIQELIVSGWDPFALNKR